MLRFKVRGFKQTLWLDYKTQKADSAPKGAFSALPAAQATGVNDKHTN